MADIAFWIIQGPGWILVAYLAAAQCVSAFDYSLGVRMGTQEPAEHVSEVGVAFFKGFAGADLFYTPLLALGLGGHILDTSWGDKILAAALGITVYWPIVCLLAVKAARGASGWSLQKETQYGVVLPAVSLWGVAGLALLPGF